MKFVDLFAGAGGLSCGLEMAGFEPVLANEVDPVCGSTYSANNPKVPLIQCDIREIDTGKLLEQLPPVDMVAGGPPCQGFSIIAPERSLDDPRNHLFEEFLRVVAVIAPRAVLIENVPGMVSFANGMVINRLYEKLGKLGYKVGHRILCAAHYGVPQMRFRTFLIGIRHRTREIQFPAPSHRANVCRNFTKSRELCYSPQPLLESEMAPHTGVMEAIGDLPQIDDGDAYSEYMYEIAATTPFQKYAREGSAAITSHFCASLSQVNRERLKHIPPGGSWRDIPFDLLPKGLQRARRSDHTKRYGRLEPHGLCSTIQTKCDPHWACFFHRNYSVYPNFASPPR